jgi:hypothetical protein
MNISLTHGTIKYFLLTGMTFLVISSTPVLADNTMPQSRSDSNASPCGRKSAGMISQTQQERIHQGCHGSDGWRRHSPQGRMYDPNNVTTVNGEVLSVDTFTRTNGMSGGMHLQLKTDNETWDVHLGPTWYLQNQEIQIQPEDNITVTGSIINWSGQSGIIAASVRKGDAALMLRDQDGVPVWHRGRGNRFHQ